MSDDPIASMRLDQFSLLVEQIPYGKKLPTAVYLMPTDQSLLPKGLLDVVRRAEVAARPDPAWNLLKLHTDQFAVSFLSYPDFETDPHPALAEATKINLNTGSVVRTDYRVRSNPPILHRKETFLPPSDQRVAVFACLTRQEEEEGLYRDVSRIGLRMTWQALLKRKRLTYEGHRLITQPCELSLAWAIARSTTVSQSWIARRLNMRSAANVSQQIRRFEKDLKQQTDSRIRNWIKSVKNC